MFIESMAGKSAALHGSYQNGTIFSFNEKNTASSYFGEQLLKAGFNYYGNEPMYSGTKGVEFQADIFIGCVYYQRLRHMVKDKFQVFLYFFLISNLFLNFLFFSFPFSLYFIVQHILKPLT